MNFAEPSVLPRHQRAMMMRPCVTLTMLLALGASAPSAFAQEKTDTRSDDLDVTMQIIVDPDAKLPDDLVRRIPLPARRPSPAQPLTRDSPPRQVDRPEPAARGREVPDQRQEQRQDQRQEQRRDISEHA